MTDPKIANDENDWSTWGRARVDFPPNMTIGAFKGKGLFGEVYEAAIVGEDSKVVVKICRDFSREFYSCDAQYKRNYLLGIASELLVLTHFSSQKDARIPKLHLPYLSEDRKDLYLTLSKADGSIKDIQAEKSLHTIPEQQVRYIMSDVLKGLAALHKEGLCHLDVSSNNVLVSYKTNSETRTEIRPNETLLSDFSFVKPLSFDLRSAHLVALGYRCPELLFLGGYGGISALIANEAKAEEEQKRYDYTKFDIFAAGVLMCELLSGNLPATVPAAAGTVVESDEASRRQFLALFTDLVPSFTMEKWSALHENYKQMREEFPSTADDLPIFSFFLSPDEQTEIKIKPKAIEVLQENGQLSSQGAALLSAMVAESPKQRPSAEDLLQHPWFQALKDEEEKEMQQKQKTEDSSNSAEKEEKGDEKHEQSEKRATAYVGIREELQKLEEMDYEHLLEWVKERVPTVATAHMMVKRS